MNGEGPVRGECAREQRADNDPRGNCECEHAVARRAHADEGGEEQDEAAAAEEAAEGAARGELAP